MSSDPAAIKARGPAGLLGRVPHLLGFPPDQSVVLVSTCGPHGRIARTLRYDLPGQGTSAEPIAGHCIQALHASDATAAVMIGYGPSRLVDPVAEVVLHALPRAGIRVHDLLRVDDGRYWSYLCSDSSCCPAEGCPVPGLGSPISMAMAAAGKRVTASRHDTAASTGLGQDQPAAARPLRTAARRLVLDAITTYRDGRAITSPERLAQLAAAVADLGVRDYARARMRPEHCAAHARLWADIARHAAPGFAAAPASLLAFTAWQDGNTKLARQALDRTQADDAAYAMAQHLRDAISLRRAASG